jgi:hypothetical protein
LPGLFSISYREYFLTLGIGFIYGVLGVAMSVGSWFNIVVSMAISFFPLSDFIGDSFGLA